MAEVERDAAPVPFSRCTCPSKRRRELELGLPRPLGERDGKLSSRETSSSPGLETLQHLQLLSSCGVEWFSYREEYLRSIGVFKDAVLAILAAVAKQERIRLSERVQAGLSRARAQGKVLGRPRAAVRPEHVFALRQRGLSIRQIADQTRVSAMTVQRILKM